MGCCQAANQVDTPSASAESRIIQRNESILNLKNKEITRLYEVLKENSSEGKLSSNQFTTWATTFQMDLTDIDTLDSKLQQFYKWFRDAKGKYDYEKLAILAVLLGKGAIGEKANVLFSTCPSFENDTIGVEGLKTHFENIFHLSIRVLPILSVEEQPEAGKSLSQEQVNAYIQKLETVANTVLQRVYTAAIGTNLRLSKQDFLLGCGLMRD